MNSGFEIDVPVIEGELQKLAGAPGEDQSVGIAGEIQASLKNLQQMYDNLREGYDSSVSQQIQNDMLECTANAAKIVSNIAVIKDQMEKAKSRINETDLAK